MNSLASYVAVIDSDLGEAWNEKLTGGPGCGSPSTFATNPLLKEETYRCP